MMPQEDVPAADLDQAYEVVVSDSHWVFKQDSFETLVQAKDARVGRVWDICETMLRGSDDEWLIAGQALRSLGGGKAIRLLLDGIQKEVAKDQIPWVIPFYNWVGEIITRRHVPRFKSLLECVTPGFRCHLTGESWNETGKKALLEVSWKQ